MTVAVGRPGNPETGSITVVIINHNTCADLRACLDSIGRDEAGRVVVFDNHSTDDGVEMVTATFPWVTVVANRTNLGYGAASNRAVALTTTPYVLLLNSDTLLQPGALTAIVSYFNRHPRAAVVGPRLHERDGTLQASCYPFPSPLDTLLENSPWAVALGRRIRRHVPLVRGLYLRTWAHDSARVVPWIKGAALGLRRVAFDDVAGFDESFFMYFEDADLCCRLGTAGWEVHFAPVTTIVHAGGASTSQWRADMAVQYLHSTWQYYEKHASRPSVALMKLIVNGLMLGRVIRCRILLLWLRDPDRRRAIADEISISRRVLGGRPGERG